MVHMETVPMVTDNLRRRTDVSTRTAVTRNERSIRRDHHEDHRRSVALERRLSNLERRTKFTTDAMLGLVSAFFAGIGTVYAGGFDPDTMIGASIIAFLVTTWIANFLFPDMTR